MADGCIGGVPPPPAQVRHRGSLKGTWTLAVQRSDVRKESEDKLEGKESVSRTPRGGVASTEREKGAVGDTLA